MGVIRVLNEGTINQIAAGEVIENPASVVKELIENSLDAGAKRIWIEIRGGGFQLIQVADDGTGMSRDDAVLSFERHATSKISGIEDLNTLRSMGFRGEALASIAAVAKVDLVTAQEGKDASEVIVEGGAILGVRSASRSRGTTISVRSLFYNVPARKKFQKSAASISSEIHRLLFSLALAHPEVGFELVSGDTALLLVAPEDDPVLLTKLEQRIGKVFDASFLQGRRALHQSQNGYELHGWIGSPADDRINRSGQYLFINRRAVVSPLISAAIKSGYGHRLDEKRYPIFVLHLTVPPNEIDVNVHPQKREVRFQNEEWLKNFLHEATKAAFKEMPPSSHSFQENSSAPLSDMPLRFREESLTQTGLLIENPEVIGLYGRYLLLDGSTVGDESEGIVWVDLQKAQEQVLLRSFQSKTPDGRSQGLLIPIPLSLNKQLQKALDEKQAVLNELGFSLEMSGKDQYLIHALPPFIEPSDAVEAVGLILEEEDPFQHIAAFAVRGKKRFMVQEALALWHQVKESPGPAVITKTGPHDIENLFR
ncbi:MAG: DNA mismatch repair endonuclease MutL [Rhabdochlamydiaceae bacterium]|jgi:DNA mismatch repair protein MutL